MSKHSKTLEKIFRNPTSSAVTWSETESLLKHLGYTKLEGSGSRVKFLNASMDNDIISLHKPHPGNELKKYVVEYLQEKLNWAKNN